MHAAMRAKLSATVLVVPVLVLGWIHRALLDYPWCSVTGHDWTWQDDNVLCSRCRCVHEKATAVILDEFDSMEGQALMACELRRHR